MRGFCRCAVYLLVLALTAHPIGQALPRRFDAGRFPFAPWQWERGGRVYKRLHIDRWKTLVPDMSRLLPDMVRKTLPDTAATSMQADALVQETCVAEVVHGASSLLGLACLWLWPTWGGIALTAAWVLLGNLPFILIQRYNRPRLVRLADLLRKREQRKGNHENTDLDL